MEYTEFVKQIAAIRNLGGESSFIITETTSKGFRLPSRKTIKHQMVLGMQIVL